MSFLEDSNLRRMRLLLSLILILPLTSVFAESCDCARDEIIDSIISAKNDLGASNKALNGLLVDFREDLKKFTNTLSKTKLTDKEEYCDYLRDINELIVNSIEDGSIKKLSSLISDLDEDLEIKTKAFTDQAGLFESPRKALQKIRISALSNNKYVDGLFVVVLPAALNRDRIFSDDRLLEPTPKAYKSVLPGRYRIALLDGQKILRGEEIKVITYENGVSDFVEVTVNAN